MIRDPIGYDLDDNSPTPTVAEPEYLPPFANLPPHPEPPAAPTPAAGPVRPPGGPSGGAVESRSWSDSGGTAFVVGDPGRSFYEVVPRLLAAPWDRPDTVVDGGRIGSLEVRAASSRGLSHRYKGVTRQDSYGLGADPNGAWLVAVVADGVSAARSSHVAASLVTRLAPDLVGQQLGTKHPADIDWYEVFAHLAGAVLQGGYRLLQRDRPELPPYDQRSKLGAGLNEVLEEVARTTSTTATVLVCATDPNSRDEREFLVAWQGDSPVWQLRLDGGWTCLSQVKGPGRDVGSSAVVALPRIPPRGRDIARSSGFMSPGEAVFVMSDGVGDPLGDGTGEVGQVLATAWRRPPDPLVFAAQVGFGRQSYDDDRTVVGVWGFQADAE